MTAGAAAARHDAAEIAPVAVRRRRTPPARMLLQGFLIVTSLVWLSPILWALYTSLRPYADTARLGYVSIGGEYNFQNYIDSWVQAELPKFFLNTFIIVVPAVILALLLASMIAFAVSRWLAAQPPPAGLHGREPAPQQVVITRSIASTCWSRHPGATHRTGAL
jgi:multiple sugar transport system permease protein